MIACMKYPHASKSASESASASQIAAYSSEADAPFSQWTARIDLVGQQVLRYNLYGALAAYASK